MNSRTKRKLAYRAKNEKGATVRNLTLADKIFIDINNDTYNHKDINRLQNVNRNNRLANSYAGGISTHLHTRKYACGVQKLHKARKSA